MSECNEKVNFMEATQPQKSGNQIEVSLKDLRQSATEFALLTRAVFLSGKTILRMSRIARKFWQEAEDSDKAVNEIYQRLGEWDPEKNQYRIVDPEKLPEATKLIGEIESEVVYLNGSRFPVNALWVKGDKPDAEDALPSILTPDFLQKLHWLIELPEDEV